MTDRKHYFSVMTLRTVPFHLRDFWSRPGHEYRLHQEIWQWFSDSPDRKRDFHYRVDADAWGRWDAPVKDGDGSAAPYGPAGIRVTTVSARRPQPSPDLWALETRPWPPPLAEGQEWTFRLRANPTVWRSSGEGGKGRHDVVMDLKFRTRKAPRAPREWPQLIHRAGMDWLNARGETRGFGADPVQVAVGRYRMVEFRLRGSRVRFGQLDYQGKLRIHNPRVFSPVLLAGIGKSRGFGCGLLELRGP